MPLPSCEEFLGLRERISVVVDERPKGPRDCDECIVCGDCGSSELLDLVDAYFYIVGVSGLFRNVVLELDLLVVAKARRVTFELGKVILKIEKNIGHGFVSRMSNGTDPNNDMRSTNLLYLSKGFHPSGNLRCWAVVKTASTDRKALVQSPQMLFEIGYNVDSKLWPWKYSGSPELWIRLRFTILGRSNRTQILKMWLKFGFSGSSLGPIIETSDSRVPTVVDKVDSTEANGSIKATSP